MSGEPQETVESTASIDINLSEGPVACIVKLYEATFMPLAMDLCRRFPGEEQRVAFWTALLGVIAGNCGGDIGHAKAREVLISLQRVVDRLIAEEASSLVQPGSPRVH